MTPNEQTRLHIGLMVKAAWEQRTNAPFPGAVRLRGGKMMDETRYAARKRCLDARKTTDFYERLLDSTQYGFEFGLGMKATKASNKIMKNLTPEQKKMEREYARMQSVIKHARFGQQSLRPINGTYSEFQHNAYKKYQDRIDRAEARMRELKALAQEAI